MPAQRLLGRRPRAFHARVPHMSALVARRRVLTPPPACRYVDRVTAPLGAMLNDQLGCCTSAGFYHQRQVWTAVASGQIDTQPDSCVLDLYEGSTGYNPADASTDQGGVEQDVLAYLTKTGAPLANGKRDKLMAFVEVDYRNQIDVRQAIEDCGGVYIGFSVPESVLPPDGSDPPAVWDYVPGKTKIVGMHCTCVPGYTPEALDTISWGDKYRMTERFWDAYVDEVYALADVTWFQVTGKTLLGMTPAELQQQMAYYH